MNLYIYSMNQLQFIGHLKLCIFIGKKKEKKNIQSTNRTFFNLIIIFPLLNLTNAFGAEDNESLARSCWVAGRYICIYIYIYIYIYIICTWLVYTIDRYATIVRLFDSYWYTNLSLTEF